MFTKKHGEELLMCPRCKINMRKIKKKNVIIDVCKKCKGLWLDDQEIEKLVSITGDNGGKKENK
jgi:Zn-finger nucleic acid-binding protein